MVRTHRQDTPWNRFHRERVTRFLSEDESGRLRPSRGSGDWVRTKRSSGSSTASSSIRRSTRFVSDFSGRQFSRPSPVLKDDTIDQGTIRDGSPLRSPSQLEMSFSLTALRKETRKIDEECIVGLYEESGMFTVAGRSRHPPTSNVNKGANSLGRSRVLWSLCSRSRSPD